MGKPSKMVENAFIAWVRQSGSNYNYWWPYELKDEDAVRDFILSPQTGEYVITTPVHISMSTTVVGNKKLNVGLSDPGKY